MVEPSSPSPRKNGKQQQQSRLPPTPERVSIQMGMSGRSISSTSSHGWREQQQHSDDGSYEVTPRAEFPGMPPSFERLKSQMSEDRRSRLDSVDSQGLTGGVSGASHSSTPSPPRHARPLPPTPTPSLVSTPSEPHVPGSPSRIDAPQRKPTVYMHRVGNDQGQKSYRRCLHDHLGEYASLTKLPDERDPTNVTPLLRCVDFGAYFRCASVPKGSVLEAMRKAIWRPIAGLVWFLGLIAWQVVFGILVSTIALVFVDRNEKVSWDSLEAGYAREYQLSHRNFGAILGFVIGFRVNIAYQSYYEGRRLVALLMTSVREVILEAYTSLPKGTAGPRFADTGEVVPGGPSKIDEDVLNEEIRYLRMTAREIRRLCMLLLAFIRQDVREKRFGFLKGTEVRRG